MLVMAPIRDLSLGMLLIRQRTEIRADRPGDDSGIFEVVAKICRAELAAFPDDLGLDLKSPLSRQAELVADLVEGTNPAVVKT